MKLKHKPPCVVSRLKAHKAQQREQRRTAAIAAHLCLLDLQHGSGTEADWNVLYHHLVVGLKIAQHHFNDEAIVEMHTALKLLSAIHADAPGRYGHWCVKAGEGVLLNRAVVLTAAMEALCSDPELARSLYAAQAAAGS